MKIEVWYDFVCPFCYLGETNFERGLQQFAHKEQVELVFRSFQLRMDGEHTKGKDINQIIADKYQISYEQSKANNDRIIEAAAEAGLHYRFDILKLNSTQLAHEIVHYARNFQKEEILIKEYFKGYFEEGMDIGDENALFHLAAKVGLNVEDLKEALKGDILKQQVKQEEEKAYQLGIDTIPHFIVNGQYEAVGAQSAEYFLNLLNQAYESK